MTTHNRNLDLTTSTNHTSNYIDDEFSREAVRRIKEVNNMRPSSNAIVGLARGWVYGYLMIFGVSLAILISGAIAYYCNKIGFVFNDQHQHIFNAIGLLFGWFCLLHAIFGGKWATVIWLSSIILLSIVVL